MPPTSPRTQVWPRTSATKSAGGSSDRRIVAGAVEIGARASALDASRAQDYLLVTSKSLSALRNVLTIVYARSIDAKNKVATRGLRCFQRARHRRRPRYHG